MCADAGDEESEMIRLHDKSLVEGSEIPFKLKGLLRRLEWGFVDRKAASTTTYTAYMMQWLQRERLIRLSDGTFRRLGALDRNDEIVLRCFKRMAAWVGLVVTTVQAEWPSFETLASSAAFALKPALKPADASENLKKLAKAFRVDYPKLQEQFNDFKVTAIRVRSKLDDGKETALNDLKASLGLSP